MGRARRAVGVALVLGLLAVVGWATIVGRDWMLHEQAADRLVAAIESTATGGVVDVATAYSIPWDRAVVIGPYWDGATANSALGFDYFPPEASVTPDDNASLLLMVRDRTVLSEVRLRSARAFFEDGIEAFTPDDGRFTVVRNDGWTTLVHE